MFSVKTRFIRSVPEPLAMRVDGELENLMGQFVLALSARDWLTAAAIQLAAWRMAQEERKSGRQQVG